MAGGTSGDPEVGALLDILRATDIGVPTGTWRVFIITATRRPGVTHGALSAKLTKWTFHLQQHVTLELTVGALLGGLVEDTNVKELGFVAVPKVTGAWHSALRDQRSRNVVCNGPC